LPKNSGNRPANRFKERFEDLVEKSGKSLFLFFVIGAVLFLAFAVMVRYSEFRNYSDQVVEEASAKNKAVLTVTARSVETAMNDVLKEVNHMADLLSSSSEPSGGSASKLFERDRSVKSTHFDFVGLNGVVLNSNLQAEVGKPYLLPELFSEVLKLKGNSTIVSAMNTCENCASARNLVAAKKVFDENGNVKGVLFGHVDLALISLPSVIEEAFSGGALVVFSNGHAIAIDQTRVSKAVEDSGMMLFDPRTADRSGSVVALSSLATDKYLVAYRFLPTAGIFIVNVLDRTSAIGAWNEILLSTVHVNYILAFAFILSVSVFALLLFGSAEAHARIRRRKEELNYVRDAAKIAWLHWRRGSDLVTMNSNSAELLGIGVADRYAFRDFLDRFDDDEAAALQSAFEDCARSGTSHRLELSTKPENGVSSTFAITTFRRGWDEKVFAVCQDLSEWQEMRSQYCHLIKMEAVGQLTGGIAHDFNNLLVMILGNIEEITREMPKDDPHHVLLDTALEACVQARGLTKQLLAFARKQPLQPTSVDVTDVVEGMAALLKRTIGKSIKIGLIVDKSVKPWQVMADRSQVEAAIVNLVINSRDALPDGGDVTISIRNKTFTENDVIGLDDLSAGDYVDIAIEDNGCGMSPEVASRAIEPYFTTKLSGRGSGLGLSQVYGFAKQSGGHVSIYSEEKKGTLVHLYLPRAKKAAYPTVQLDPETSAAEFGNETILVVEDEENVRTHIQRVLTGLGYKVISRIDGKSALKLVEQGVKFDLLLTDIALPGGLDGTALAAKVREKLPSTPIVYVSGNAEGAQDSSGVMSDVALLEKPFLRSELAGKIRSALDKDMAA